MDRLKKIRMGSGTNRNNFFTCLFVYQKPVRFYVQFPMVLPVPFERMIMQPLGQHLFPDKRLDNLLQFLDILSAAFLPNPNLLQKVWLSQKEALFASTPKV